MFGVRVRLAEPRLVNRDIRRSPDGRNLSGRFSVPLTSITVDADPTRTEPFRQRATNRSADPARRMLAAQPEQFAVSLPQVHFRAKVVAGEDTLELTLFASARGPSARLRASRENAPCSTRPSTRSSNEERKCRT